jgi:crotonobetainyl-CoA:carnitine CoA-transferase CaiB-like acyl-CoA transferase
MHAAFACLAALENRDRHGEGGVVEVAMLDTAAFAALGQALAWQADGVEPARIGNRHPSRCPRGVYPTRGDDRWVAIDVESTADWLALAEIVGRQDWHHDAWRDESHRRSNADVIDDAITTWTLGRSDEEVVATLSAVGVPCARVTGSGRVPDNPQFVHRAFFDWIDHPVAGRHPVPGLPFRSRRRAVRWNRTPAPSLGRDTDEVLREWLALADSELDELEDQGITGTRPSNLDQEASA